MKRPSREGSMSALLRKVACTALRGTIPETNCFGLCDGLVMTYELLTDITF